jgi:hypothetical protein
MIIKTLAVLSAVLVVGCALLVPVKADFIINQTGPLNIVAGDSVTENITFKFQSSNSNVMTGFSIMTIILPDPYGINVTYSNVPQTLVPNIYYTIQMHIATSMMLAPGQYIITSAVHANQSSPTPPPTKPHVRHTSSGNQPPPNPPPPDTRLPHLPSETSCAYDISWQDPDPGGMIRSAGRHFNAARRHSVQEPVNVGDERCRFLS